MQACVEVSCSPICHTDAWSSGRPRLAAVRSPRLTPNSTAAEPAPEAGDAVAAKAAAWSTRRRPAPKIMTVRILSVSQNKLITIKEK